MKKPFSILPYWAKVVIRLALLPAAATLHIIPYLIAFVSRLYRWVMYGGEFTVYRKDEPATIQDIYDELKEQRSEKLVDNV